MLDGPPNKVTSRRQIRRGLSIYQTGRSPYWMIRLRDPFRGRYVVRSSKETLRAEAIAAANEFEQDFFRKANSAVGNDKKSSFEHYTEQMRALEKSRRVSHDSDRKLLYRQKDGIISSLPKMGGLGMGRAGLFDLVPTAEDAGRP
jgi:hypothetical protein